MTREEWELCKHHALRLFKFGQKVADENGMILVDNKHEFGKDLEVIVLIDEVHTPDSSRYWVRIVMRVDFIKEWNRKH